MSKFSGSYKGYPFEVFTDVSAVGTLATFRSSVLEEKTYTSEQDLEKAIDAFDLKQRKDFKNGTAWMIQPKYSWSKETEKFSRVTVTSTDGDDAAWVKQADGRRAKEQRRNLFATKAAAEAYSNESEALRAAWETGLKALDARRDLWVPQP